MSIATGELLGGRYRLTERIAIGGMGEVWRAQDETLGRLVAAKLLKREYADDPGFVERFRAEARHTAGLAHPGIASVFDYGETDGFPYLIMELVDGEPLSAVITREGRLDARRTLTIMGQAATGLHAAHVAGVVHRDVKPGNILVTADDHVKVTDFGVARVVDSVPLTQTGMVIGTAHYLSPEQGRGLDATASSDVYSLGVVAYECLAGRRPFEGAPMQLATAHVHQDPPPLPDDVPEPVRLLVEQAMAKDPSQRFDTAAAFARACALMQERLAGEISGPLADAVAAPTMVLHVAELPDAVPAAVDAGAVVRNRRMSRRAAVVLGAIVALLLIAALGVAVERALPDDVAIPKVAGLGEAAAVQALAAVDLDARPTRQPHDTVRKGVVISSDPGPGAVVKEGDDVRIFVSSGPKPVALPAGLIGRDADSVEQTLVSLGVRVTRRDAFSDQETGSVIRIEPTTGLVRGSTVTLVVDVAPKDDGDGKGKGRDKDDD